MHAARQPFRMQPQLLHHRSGSWVLGRNLSTHAIIFLHERGNNTGHTGTSVLSLRKEARAACLQPVLAHTGVTNMNTHAPIIQGLLCWEARQHLRNKLLCPCSSCCCC